MSRLAQAIAKAAGLEKSMTKTSSFALKQSATLPVSNPREKGRSALHAQRTLQ